MAGRRREYRLQYDPRIKEHLKALTTAEQAAALDVIENVILPDPLRESRNQFRMRPNRWATWERRDGDLRILYDILSDDEGEVVYVQVIGQKARNVLMAGGEEIDTNA